MRKSGEYCKLPELKIGQAGQVISLEEKNRAIRRHMLDMGITKGVKITVRKVAPLGDPIDISLRDYELCIRKEDLAQISVEVL